MVINNKKYLLVGAIIMPSLILVLARFYAKSYLLQLSFHTTTVTQLLLVVIVSPIVEEIVFRGLLQEFLLKIINNNYVAIVMVNLIFMWLHCYKDLGLFYLLCIFVCGMIFSAIQYVFKSILYPISLHCYYNLLFIFFILGVS